MLSSTNVLSVFVDILRYIQPIGYKVDILVRVNMCFHTKDTKESKNILIKVEGILLEPSTVCLAS